MSVAAIHAASVSVLRSSQAPSAVVMIRPHHFCVNTETAGDNSFQTRAGDDHPLSNQQTSGQQTLAKRAYEEVGRAVELLQKAGVRTHVFEDFGTATPDSVFPNNWFSTHSPEPADLPADVLADGQVVLYPMFAPNRRKERRVDVIEMLKKEYQVRTVIDYSGLEHQRLYLEGTGSMVLDHIERVAYSIPSNRTHPVVLERFCAEFHYEPVMFDAADSSGRPIYHTNVLMCIATEFVMLGLDMIGDLERREYLVKRFEASGRTVIALSREQINNFAGNALELKTPSGRVLALSSRALKSLTPDQLAVISRSATPLPLDIETIEMAGGSVRCMLAGIHLAKR